MPVGKVHRVLCAVCGTAASTLYAYEERRCGVTATVATVQVSCTNTGNKDCGQGVHYDKNMSIRFEEHGRLKSSRTGATGRA